MNNQTIKLTSAAVSGACLWLVASPAISQVQERDARPTEVGEVVVTAQRRSERLQDVPISIAVQSGEQLARAGITDVRDLGLVTPGLKIDQTGAGFTTPALRGVSTSLTGAGSEANVAIYVDGVYQPSAIANTFDLADVSRVEVAKGPQGTLFGRNATGGAVSVFTLAPSFTPTGSAYVSYGRFNDLLVKGYVSGPLVEDKLAGSISLFFNRNEDYSLNLVSGSRGDGLNSRIARGKLLWTPTDWASLTFTAMYARRHASNGANGQPWRGNTDGRLTNALFPTEVWQIAMNDKPYVDHKTAAFTLTGEFDLGAGTLTSQTSYIDTVYHLYADSDVSTARTSQNDLTSPNQTWQQEFIFSSRKFGRLSFVGGLFGYLDKTGWDPIIAVDGRYVAWSYQKTVAWAPFGEVNLDLTDRLSLIGGLRYSYERKKTGGIARFGGFVIDQGDGPGQSWKALTPRVAIKYKLSDEVNAYATFSKGFKSGGLGTTAFRVAQVWEPEKISAYEVGLKSNFGRIFRGNVAAYYYDYTDQQVAAFVLGAQGQSSSINTNAASSSIYGLDVDGTTWLTDEFSLTASAAILSAKYDVFKAASINLPRIVNGQPSGNIPVGADVSGNTMIRAPKFSASLTANYTKEIGAGRVDLSTTVFHSSKFYLEVSDRVVQPSYTLISARAAWTPTGSKFRFEVWGKNLTNKAVIAGAYILANADNVGYSPPRTYGVALNYAF
jgi:iron complex outermembrane receptor protein